MVQQKERGSLIHRAGSTSIAIPVQCLAVEETKLATTALEAWLFRPCGGAKRGTKGA